MQDEGLPRIVQNFGFADGYYWFSGADVAYDQHREHCHLGPAEGFACAISRVLHGHIVRADLRLLWHPDSCTRRGVHVGFRRVEGTGEA